jgi:predicted DNA-binding transcriptional regulator YafY
MKKDYNKTQRVLWLIRTIINTPNNMINDVTFREVMGNPSKATYHKLIVELTTDNGEIEALLKREGLNDDYNYYLNESYADLKGANSQTEFVLECYSRLGSILPEEMQNRLSHITNQKINKTKNLNRKFCHVKPIEGRELGPNQKKYLSLIVSAILSQKEVMITYKDAKDLTSTFVFRPFTLCMYRDDLYLLGDRLLDKEYSYKNCKIRRVLNIVQLDSSFSYPSNKYWNPQVEFSGTSGIINKRQESYDVQVKIYGESRKAFQEKKFFNNKLIIAENDYDHYEMTCTSFNEFLGQLFVYAQDVEIVNNPEMKKLFLEKAMIAIERNQKVELKKVS